MRGAPTPGDESGRTDPIDPGDGTGRKIARALLWIPRLPVELVAQPVRGFLYVNDRYDAVNKVKDSFVTDDRRISFYPTALFETGFGLNVGVRGFFKDIFRKSESVHLRTAFGGEFRWIAEAGFESGRLLPRPWSFELDTHLTERDKERFFGYGNSDLTTTSMPIDPLAADIAIPTRYRVEVQRAIGRLKLRLPANLAVTETTAVTRKVFARDTAADDDLPIDEAYMVESVPGFVDGTTFLYNELELAWDTRRPAHRWDAPGIRGTGGLVLAYAGHQHGLDGEPDFFRTGVDLQHYVRITSRPRVLELRFVAEAVTGARDEVPFTELPKLGGESILRGYPSDRFRDRIATVAQASYRWAAANWLAPALFVDVGRVHSSLDQLSLEDPRVGFGAALEGFSRRGLVFRAEIASSIDGGVFVYLALNPAFDAGSRAGRY